MGFSRTRQKRRCTCSAWAGGHGCATRDKDALQQRRSGFSLCERSNCDMTSASYSMAGEPRRWSRHGFRMQAARAAGTMPYAGLGRVQSKLFPVRRRGTHWTAIVGYPATLYSCMSGLTGALAGLQFGRGQAKITLQPRRSSERRRRDEKSKCSRQAGGQAGSIGARRPSVQCEARARPQQRVRATGQDSDGNGSTSALAGVGVVVVMVAEDTGLGRVQ
jgi:hypothetical protein